MKLILGTLLAVCIGITLGLIGGGGSILALPILKYVMGVETKSAVAMTLVIVGIVSLIGVIPHWLQGNVNFKTALLFSPAVAIKPLYTVTPQYFKVKGHWCFIKK